MFVETLLSEELLAVIPVKDLSRMITDYCHYSPRFDLKQGDSIILLLGKCDTCQVFGENRHSPGTRCECGTMFRANITQVGGGIVKVCNVYDYIYLTLNLNEYLLDFDRKENSILAQHKDNPSDSGFLANEIICY